MPGEKPEVAVYSHNIKQLEFRVYRINDPIKYFGQLQDLHSFGGRAPALPKQPHTWLEKFHTWKHGIWAWIRDFVRAQFSVENRHQIRLWRLGETEQPKKQGPQVENYALVPVLNQQQVVSVWKWTTGSHQPWESETVKVPVSDKGVYLVEATNGSLRAYTIVVVTDIAVISKAAPGRLVSMVVDRQSGDPIVGHRSGWIDQQRGRVRAIPTRRECSTLTIADEQAGERCGAGVTHARSVRHQHSRSVEPGQRSRPQSAAAIPTPTARCTGPATRCTSRPSFALQNPAAYTHPAGTRGSP